MEGVEESKKMIKVPNKEQFLDNWMEQFLGACITQDSTWSSKVLTAIDSIRHLTPSESEFMRLANDE